MMVRARKKQMKNLLGILRDKTALIKLALSIKRASTASSIHVAVIRATAHSSPASPPPEHLVAAVLSLGHNSLPAASECVAAIMDRLHKTSDAYVALKCLFTLHQINRRGSLVIREQLSFYPAAGGRNFLNLSTFRDGGDSESWELSAWVRWFASVLEHYIMASRALGVFFSSPTTESKNDNSSRVNSAPGSNSDLMRETDALVALVEQISRAPDSLQCLRHDLVYEIVNLVGEDYRSTQHQIRVRVCEFWKKTDELSSEEMAELTSCLERLEGSREGLKALFGNRKRNDAFWDLVRETKTGVEELREKQRWLVVRREDGSELTRTRGLVPRPSQPAAAW